MSEEFQFSFIPKTPKLRPCKVGGEDALFHRWVDYAMVIGPSPMVGGHHGGQVWETYAIVEMEGGQIREVKPSNVVFTDTREYAAIHANVELKSTERTTRMLRKYSRPGVYADLWLHCEACGGMVNDDWRYKFCPECGARVIAQEGYES